MTCALVGQEVQVPDEFTMVIPGDDEPDAIYCEFTCPSCGGFVSRSYVVDFHELPYRVVVMQHGDA